MYLKRLELQGYKTFATKTQFEFDAGITAIVGPNGSGKSNIADALRWVLGEHRYGTLRAKRGDDMIFAGGEGRARVGMAEVSLTLDNSTAWLPIDYSEITIQRRTYRSGENQYFLNGSRARRRDIVELLAGGGVSSNTYTIISQGAVDVSLGMRPEERRSIFEEAAGIAIHQAKREQALSKLEDTRDNILRVNDIIGEIAPRLRRLSKQAERAREYQEASQKLQGALETWHSYRWRRAQEELQAAVQQEERRQEALAAEKGRLEEYSGKIDELRKLRAEVRGQLGGWHSESGDLHSRLEGLQRELAVKQERQRLIQQRRHEIQQEISPLRASRDARLLRTQELEAELNRLAEERRQRGTDWQAVEQELIGAETQRQQLESELATGQETAFELATGLADLRNRLKQLGERRRDVQKEREEHEQAGERVAEQREEIARNIDALQADRDRIAAQLEDSKKQEETKQHALQEVLEKQDRLQNRQEKVREQLGRLQVRHEVLTKARTELADYSQAVQAVLSQDRELPGIVGSVVELVDVPAELERAIGAALGSLLQAIVTETWKDARRALNAVVEGDAGRATFLPLDSLKPITLRNVPHGPGVLGLAPDLVGIRQGLEPVLRALLGHTLIVQDLDAAYEVHTRHADVQAVTLAGQMVSATGALTGGSDASGSLLLAHERERRELPQQIAAVKIDEESLQAELDREKVRHNELVDEIAALGEQSATLDKASREKDEELSSWRIRLDRVTQELEWHREAASRLAQEVETLEEKERAIRSEVTASKENERETTEAINLLREQYESLDVNPLREKLAGLKTTIAVLDRSKESQETVLAGHHSGLQQIESQLVEKEERVAELSAEAEELERAIASLTEQVSGETVLVDELSSRIAEAEQQLTSLEKQQSELEHGEAAGRRRLQEYEAAYNKAILKRQRCGDELRNLQERIEADLETVVMSTDLPRQLPLDIDARLRSLPVVTEVPKGLESDIKHLRRRLRLLGPVDPEAVDEYQQVSERHAFMIGQVEDLDRAAHSLHKVVAELDRVMEDKFVETFDKVAVEFGSFFSSLFNGGEASLVLTEPENPLQSGVEILAQPPGRRRRSVAMLSGGEKALTGVALTFAILKACETPFCFLDEVDARLDEVNVTRFGDSLRELSAKTQLVVITHNRATLEKADSVYGITMSGDGASRVLSLRLEEAEQKVGEDTAA